MRLGSHDLIGPKVAKSEAQGNMLEGLARGPTELWVASLNSEMRKKKAEQNDDLPCGVMTDEDKPANHIYVGLDISLRPSWTVG